MILYLSIATEQLGTKHAQQLSSYAKLCLFAAERKWGRTGTKPDNLHFVIIANNDSFSNASLLSKICKCIRFVCMSDAIVLLPQWQLSKRCKLEYVLARLLFKHVVFFTTSKPHFSRWPDLRHTEDMPAFVSAYHKNS